MSFSVDVQPFGYSKLITLRSPALQVGITTLGATLHSVKVWTGRRRKWVEVNVHHENYEEAKADCATYFGATVGRFAGRIGHGTFVLDNREHYTPKNNNNTHTIHGGGKAFDKVEWGFKVLQWPDSTGVRFEYVSPHMENGFPAELCCSVAYTIPHRTPAALRMDFGAFIPETSPADATIVNLFNHAYWNLNGVPERDGDPAKPRRQPETVHNHWLRLPNCSLVAATDADAVPSGELQSVAGTVLDFRNGRCLGIGINNKKDLNRDPSGYDHPYVISGYQPGNRQPRHNADCYSPSTGIRMHVCSTFPCLWVYTANNLKQDASGLRGERYRRYSAICIEPQHMPDAANHKEFPQSVVRRGQPYHESTINVFTVSKLRANL